MEYVDEAVRSQVWARVFFMAPTGGGKSRAAFELGSRLFGGLPLTYINTERDREKIYADRFKFGLIDLSREGDFSPETFVDAFDLAEKHNPGGVIILDSASHEWMGANGVLNQADRFGDWKTVRPKHNAFVERILACNAHVIVCCRAKMKYEVTEEEVPGRSKPRQVVSMMGVGPIQDDGLQYEFNLVGRFEVETHECMLSGHVDALIGTVVDFVADADQVAETYTKWLSEGTPIEIPVAATSEEVELLVVSLLEEGIKQATIDEKFAARRREDRGVLSPEYVGDQHKKSVDRLKRKASAKAKAEEGAGGSEMASAASEASDGGAAPPEGSEAATAPQDAAAVDPVVAAQERLAELAPTTGTYERDPA